MSQAEALYDTHAAKAFCQLLDKQPKLATQSSEQLRKELDTALADFPTEAYIIWQAYRHGAAELLAEHTTPDSLAAQLSDSLAQACGMHQPAVEFAAYAWSKTLIAGFGQQAHATADSPPPPESPAAVTDIDIPNPELLPSVGDKKRLPDYSLPEGFELTADFEAAFEFVETTKNHLLLTGKAGTGKSTWLHYFALHTNKEFVVLAPTGVAAVKIGAQTIHSFFGLPPRAMMPADPDIRVFGKNHPTREIIKHADTIIIDEISMVRADLLDAIDTALRKNTGYKSLPFGGKQIVMIGDLHQLPPVVGKNELDKQLYPAYAKPNRGGPSAPIQDQTMLFGQHYDTPYFFSANVLQSAPLNVIQLQTIFRQHDDAFIDMLNRIRRGDRNADMLRSLNKRLNPNFVPDNDDFIITLVPTNRAAKKLNEAAMARLPDEPHLYRGEIDGEFERGRLPTDFKLELKVGAQVMFVRNDPARRWVNGSIGTVTQLEDEYVMVANADGEELTVTRYTWENTRYSWNKQQKVVETETVGTFTQFPLQLAWAVTIHKSQGLTFERVVVDLGRGAFAHGQTYVALSRCRSLEGLILKTRVKARDILLDPNVLEFTQEWEGDA